MTKSKFKIPFLSRIFENKRELLFDEKRRIAVFSAGFDIASLTIHNVPPAYEAFTAVITYRGKKSFTVSYDGKSERYEYQGNQELIEKFENFANTVIRPLHIGHERRLDMRKVISDPTQWEATDATAAFMADDFEDTFVYSA